jgi:hypothetical protein
VWLESQVSVERLVAARVCVHEHGAVRLDHHEPSRLGENGGQPAGVEHLAAGHDQSHAGRKLLSQSDRCGRGPKACGRAAAGHGGLLTGLVSVRLVMCERSLSSHRFRRSQVEPAQAVTTVRSPTRNRSQHRRSSCRHRQRSWPSVRRLQPSSATRLRVQRGCRTDSSPPQGQDASLKSSGLGVGGPGGNGLSVQARPLINTLSSRPRRARSGTPPSWSTVPPGIPPRVFASCAL